jgi:hypothetical protein
MRKDVASFASARLAASKARRILDRTCLFTVRAAAGFIPARSSSLSAFPLVLVLGVDVNLLLAHLQNGSVAVKIGHRISAGQLIGKVGNSGNTSEPHLHIHAQKQVTKGSGSTWAPVPIRFGSRWLVRNSVVVA